MLIANVMISLEIRFSCEHLHFFECIEEVPVPTTGRSLFAYVLSELGRHRATIRDIREAKINERDDLSLIFVLIPM